MGLDRRPVPCHRRQFPWIASALLIALFLAGAGATMAAQPEVRLLVPYPLTGPREIQGADRMTRTYRAVAAHAVPPITDLIADQVSYAIAGRGEYRVMRERTSGLGTARTRQLVVGPDAATSTVVLVGAESVSVEPYVHASVTWYPERKLIPVAPIAIMPFVLLCNPKACPSATSTDLVRTAATGQSRFGSSGEASLSRLSGELLRRSLGTRVLHVPYPGGNAALSATIAGQVDWMFAALPLALPYVQNGKLLALGLASRSAFPLLPRLPTLQQSGMEEFVVEGWFAAFASRDAPETFVSAMRQRIESAGRSGPARAALLMRGLVPAEESSDEFQRRMSADVARWHAVIKDSR